MASGSGAGKSLLQDTLLKLCPDEDLVKLTSLTGEALFYMGQDALKHKVLALEEHAGAQEADYAIRNLISAKKLVKEATIKDPMTGRLTTMRNVVDGPCAVFKTTTQPEMDAETKTGRRPGKSRNCIFLCTDDSALLRGAALILLWQQGYVEPIVPPMLLRRLRSALRGDESSALK